MTAGPGCPPTAEARTPLIRVLIVDDHEGLRAGLARLLSSLEGVDLAGEATDGHDAIERTRQLRPDVVLMDLQMPGMDGVAATRQILAECPGTAVLVLTSIPVRGKISEALAAGACGYLLKDASADELAERVRGAAARATPRHPVVVLGDEPLRGGAPRALSPLAARHARSAEARPSR
ncbi:MAG: hypothetical protein QOE11_2503 [Solirubrobacteraceae bacterium]|nr:hypothetical protein [Solirubrobacteraceae bacterium]